MQVIDTRRLTGPNHLARARLVIVEVALDPGETMEQALEAYRKELARMREALALPPAPPMITRPHHGGAAFAYEAPIDIMLACAEMSEWAALGACELLAARERLPLEPKRTEIAGMLASERNPDLVAIVEEARARGVPLLWDDELVSVGTGRFAQCFMMGMLPDVASIPWSELGGIPIALVTGTNGKTTSSRLLARVAIEAGLRAGAASTGGITVGTELLEDGDWTGPAAARVVLRRADVELAVLETARGGILRRGLAVDTCDVALLTNVSDDHLGLFGIDDVAAMTRVKGVAAHAVRRGGVAVLNAHDANLVGLAAELECDVTFFADLERAGAPSVVAAREVIARHRAQGKRVVFAEGGAIHSARGTESESLLRVDAIPITFGGAARYNVENVLGVVGAAEALGLSRDAIVRALSAFSNDDNPGRGQVVVRGGVTVVLDFGHNAEGVRSVMQLVSSLRKTSGRLTVVAGSPGDRTDREIAAVAQAIYDAKPDRVLVRELEDYLRGRAPGDVPALFRGAFLELGLPSDAFEVVPSEVVALERTLSGAAAGDVVCVLVHLENDAVASLLRGSSGR